MLEQKDIDKNNFNTIKTDVLIIGAGPVGLFAVFIAGQLGMKCCLVDTLNDIGGQCIALYPEKPIYDIPAHKVITAKQLVANLQEQASPFDPEFLLGQQIINVQHMPDKSFKSFTSTGNIIESKIILIAAGSGAFVPNKPPLEDIHHYEGSSVLYSVQDPSIFEGKKIAIAGGGDSAIDWAIILSKIASKIYIIHRREKFRCSEKSLRDLHNLVEQGLVEMLIPYQLEGLKPLENRKNMLKNVVLRNFQDESLKELEVDFLLPFFGLKMDLGPIKNWDLDLDHNHIKANNFHCQTNVEGIYAIGDVVSYPGKVKLILTGFAEATMSLYHAYGIVFSGKELHFQYSTTQGIPKK